MEDEGLSPLGVAGALATLYAQDTRGFLPLLAVVLQAAMPDECMVERRGGLFQKNKPVGKVIITLGDNQYTLEDMGRGPLAAHRVKVVRGIVLKTELMPVDEWLAVLSEEIAVRAERHEKAYYALQQMLRDQGI